MTRVENLGISTVSARSDGRNIPLRRVNKEVSGTLASVFRLLMR